MRRIVAVLVVALACCLCLAAGGLAAQGVAKPTAPHVVSVHADGLIYLISTSASTVADVLTELDITLSPLDRTRPSPGTAVSPGLEVHVTRVTRRDIVEEATLPARTIVLADPDRPVGFSKILARGKDGRVRRLWRVWEKDGQVTLRSAISEECLSPTTDTVILRGTRGAPSRGGDWRAPLRMEATAYDPGPRSCGKYASGYTATGVKAEKGIVAVDDRVIPMGSRLYIPGYGFAVAADRGSAIRGMRIDLCFPTYQEARRFGRRPVKVYVLN
jgi:3D (Asp-Asp-Asp) domain-containing protein